MNRVQIVAGIDGSASSWRALEWAAHRAETTDRHLLVACLGEAGERLGNYGYGDTLATDVVVALTRTHPSLLVHTVGIVGNPVEFLLHCADDAAMVVLGRDPHASSLMSLAPTLAALLQRSECPVVVAGGPATPGDNAGTRIVLGVSASDGGRAAMHFACEEATRAGVPVLAVRSSSDPRWPSTDDSALSPTPTVREAHEHDVLAACVEDARAHHPEVVISGLLTKEAIRFALARESRDAFLVALGRGTNDVNRGRQPGPDTLIAVYSLPCAVAVVGSGRNGEQDEARTERATLATPALR
jgi:nucleotide-binding universal stress UspA family protein